MNLRNNRKEVLIKVLAPGHLKNDLQELANSRNVSLSALVRIALSEYVKNQK
jgi:predicted transcriptional regulator